MKISLTMGGVWVNLNSLPPEYQVKMLPTPVGRMLATSNMVSWIEGFF
jgi:hypothetical protein